MPLLQAYGCSTSKLWSKAADYGPKKATVRREVLDALGFNYKVFSGIYRSSKGLVYYISYDYAFSPLRDDNHVEKALVVQTQDYFSSQAYNPWSYVKT